MDELRAAQLLGVPERRIRTTDLDIRANSDSTYTVRGYASVVEHAYEVYGGPDRGGWNETIARDAFNATLAAKPDVVFLLNHEGMPLARTKSGTLSLSADNTGLLQEATIDRRDPEGQALEVKMERGDVDEMSFAFRVMRQEWNAEYDDRRITEVNLDHGDVSAVTFGANPATSISISARSAIATLRAMELAEIRGEMPADELRAAHEHLAELVSALEPEAKTDTVEIEVTPVLRETDTLAEEIREIARKALVDIVPAAREFGTADAIAVLRALAEAGEHADELRGLTEHLAVLLTPAPAEEEDVDTKRGMSLAYARAVATVGD